MPLIINGRAISEAAIESEFSQIKAYHERLHQVSCCERDPEFRKTARDQIISRVLLAEEASRLIGESSAEEVDAALENVKRDYGGEAHLYATLGIAPSQIDMVRKDLDVTIRVQKLMEQLVAGESEPPEQVLRELYEQNVAAFTSAEERRASHISKAAGPMTDRSGAVEVLREVRRQLMEGADFEELARLHSDRGKDLIDLGLFRRGDLPEDVEIVAFSMQVGEISPLFASAVGLHILKLTEIKPPAATPFEKSRPDVLRLYWEQQKQKRAQELVERLRARATIEEIAPQADGDDGEVAGNGE